MDGIDKQSWSKMTKIKNTDLVRKVIYIIIVIAGRRTSITISCAFMEAVLKTLQKKYDFLKYVTIKNLSYYEGDRSNAIQIKKSQVDSIDSKEIVTFLAHLLSAQLPQEVTEEGRLQLRMADEYESVSDYVANILKSYMRMKKEGLNLLDEELKSIMELHEKIEAYIRLINKALKQRNQDIVSKARSQGDEITHNIREFREEHIANLTKMKIDPLVNSSYCDMLNSYRRVKDHTLNISEALAGEK